MFCNMVLDRVMKALQCPFLSRLPISSVSKNAPVLLSIADHCPVMKHAVHYTKVASVSGKEITGRIRILSQPTALY